MSKILLDQTSPETDLLTDKLIAEFGVEPGWRFGQPFRTRWSEQDAFGHVNHKAHLVWCEEVRNAYLASAGYPLQDAAHPGPVLREISCSYEKALGLGETILVTARTDWVGDTSFGMSYAIWRNGLVARSRAVCVWYVNSLARGMTVPDALRAYMLELDNSEDRKKS